jgi:hypothetical protein
VLADALVIDGIIRILFQYMQHRSGAVAWFNSLTSLVYKLVLTSAWLCMLLPDAGHGGHTVPPAGAAAQVRLLVTALQSVTNMLSYTALTGGKHNVASKACTTA